MGFGSFLVMSLVVNVRAFLKSFTIGSSVRNVTSICIASVVNCLRTHMENLAMVFVSSVDEEMSL